MTTSRKSESARANGAKSRGPTSPDGKLASSQNATQHGIFSRTMVLQYESQHRFEQVLADLKDQVQPRNSTEPGYVEMMAIARWRQMRVWAVQKAAIELEMARVESASMESARIESGNQVASETAAADLTPVVLAILAYRTLSDDNFLDRLHRYETSYDRQFAKAQAAIQIMRRQELLDAKDSACLPSNPVASVPHLATPLTAPTFMDPSAPAKKLFCKTNPRPKMKHEQTASQAMHENPKVWRTFEDTFAQIGSTRPKTFLDRLTSPQTKSCMRTPSEDSAAAFALFSQRTSKNVLKNVHDSQWASSGRNAAGPMRHTWPRRVSGAILLA